MRAIALLVVSLLATSSFAAPPSLQLDEAALLEHTRTALTSVPRTRRPPLTARRDVVLVGHRVRTNYKEHTGGLYDDVLVAVYWRDGVQHARAFAFNTEASGQFEGAFGQDANHDGRRDFARLPAGTYRYALGTAGFLGRVLRPEQAQQVDRDIHHDGSFRGGVRSSAARSILFHTGLTDDDTWSAGCQTMAPQTFTAFLALLDEQAPRRITYVLVDDP
jgi:hypothetical protein